MREDALLKRLVVVNLLTSGGHFLHNAIFLNSYPGPLWIPGRVVAQLRIAQATAESQITPLGGDLYRAALLPEADPATRVRQGFLETSNVESVHEMVRLIETMRHFETTQRFVRGYDDMMSKAITELGKV
jgi:flagellar basal body rod protein FlgG